MSIRTAPDDTRRIRVSAQVAVLFFVPALLSAFASVTAEPSKDSGVFIVLLAMTGATSLLAWDQSPNGRDHIHIAGWSLTVMALLIPTAALLVVPDPTTIGGQFMIVTIALGLVAAMDAVTAHRVSLGHSNFVAVQAAATLALIVGLFIIL